MPPGASTGCKGLVRELDDVDQGHRVELRTRLAGVRRRWMAVRLLWALASLLAAVGVGLLAVLAVEILIAPADEPMLMVTGLALAAIGLFAVRVLWPLRTPPADRVVARFVEERCPELEDRVASATELGETAAPTPFHQLVVVDAADRLRTVDVGRIVPAAHLRAAALRGGLAAVVLGLVLVLGIAPIGRVARTAWLFAFPSRVMLDVEPGDVRLMAGQPLRVRVRLAGGGSLAARNPPIVTLTAGGVRRVVTMQARPDGYVTEFPAVRDSVSYHVSAAALRSRDYRVDVLTAPRVRRIDIEYLYPEFTGRSPHVEEDGGDVYAPAGTAVRVRVHADTPIVAGRLTFSDGGRRSLTSTGAEALTAAFEVEADGEYTVSVTAANGLSSPGDVTYVIRATPDRPPDVQVLRPGDDREITSLEEVLIEARATDDYRIDALDLVYTVVGRPARTVLLDTPRSVETAVGSHTLFAEELEVAPGDFITYFARARDVGVTGQSRETRSDIFFLEVRPFDNEFELAQSQSATGREADEIGDLAAVQKEIIVATWRMDPQPRSTTLAADLRVVGMAQGDLRTRTASAAERLLARGRERAAGDTGPAPENAALAAAVEAMGAAQAALEALDSGAALPYEMEALNQLLRAQAEVRRRLVSMQQGQGAQTPGGQAREDLSALFDRELRREQETNYETGASPDERTGGAESDARRRLRELAERQAALNRRFEEQAAAPAETSRDEARRVLERLTREQRELREQLEELADQLRRELNRGGASGGGRAGGDPVEPIAEQMREATSALRRRETENARANGGRALDELRRLAQRMGGAAAEEQNGARSAAQMDMQRLARQLESVQAAREALRQLRTASESARSSDTQPDAGVTRSPATQPPAETDPASARDQRPGGQLQAPDADPVSDEGGDASPGGTSGGQGRLDELRREYVASLERNAALMEELRRENPELGRNLDQWAEYWQSLSAPGTGRFKQDLAPWASLRQHLDTALQRFEADRLRQLAASEMGDRLTAGLGETLPARYRRLVDEYYRSLATAPGRP